MAAFLSTLEGILVLASIFAAGWFYVDWTDHTRCYLCGKTYNKRQFFCTDCNIRVLGPCEACGKHQKWKGLGCTQCGHKLGDPIPVPISSPIQVRSIPDTSPSLTIINLPSCPDCRNQISPGATFCGNCGFNLEQTMIREQE